MMSYKAMTKDDLSLISKFKCCLTGKKVFPNFRKNKI